MHIVHLGSGTSVLRFGSSCIHNLAVRSPSTLSQTVLPGRGQRGSVAQLAKGGQSGLLRLILSSVCCSEITPPLPSIVDEWLAIDVMARW